MANKSTKAVTSQGTQIWFDPEDEELQGIWNDVVNRVTRMAGVVDGAKLDPNLDVNGVLTLVEKTQSADEKASESRLVRVVDKTLSCIQMVGGMVADVASNVFGPANACFNALNFVIQAYQGYQGMFKSLEGLLDECFQFLERLTFYKSMDAFLRKVICRHLSLFVEICEYTISLRRKRNQFKAFMSNTFTGDTHVKDLLERMENLKGREFGLVHAQTLSTAKTVEVKVDSMGEDLKGVGLGVTALLAVDKEKKVEKATDKLLESFLHALSWNPADPEAWEDVPLTRHDGLKRQPKKAWATNLRRHIENQTVETMGDWIKTNTDFVNWKNGTDGSSPSILGLEGGNGSGKTALAASIIRHLQDQSTYNSESRSPVAYFFIEPDPKTQPSEMPGIVTRSILWQLGLDNRDFLKSAMAAWEETRVGAVSKPIELWKQMLFSGRNQASTATVTPFFIVIDGLSEEFQFHDLLRPLLQLITNRDLNPHVRLLLTGNTSIFNVLRNPEGVEFDTIMLESFNSSDIELYITHHLKKMSFLQDDTPEVARVKKKIMDTLQKATSGDYRKISLVLSKIEADPENLDEILQGAGTSAAEQFRSDIQKLNETCSVQEIAEINEVILWLLDGEAWYNPAAIQAALNLKARIDADEKAPAEGLSLLKYKIEKGRYPIFELDADGDLVFKLDRTEARKEIPLRSDDPHAATASSRKDLHPAEVDLVKHYLKTLCPEQLYTKFGFDKFFEESTIRRQKPDGGGSYIHQDKDNAHLLIAMRCLVCLAKQRTSKVRGLHTYAVYYLYSQLFSAAYKKTEDDDNGGKAVKREELLALADHNYRVQAGVLLLKLLTEDYGIRSLLDIAPDDASSYYGEEREESWLSSLRVPSHWSEWVLTSKGVDIVAAFFRDPSVSDKIRYAEYVKQVTSEEGNKLEVFFDPAVKILGEYFQRPDAKKADVENAFLFLLFHKATLDGKDLADSSDHEQYFLDITADNVRDVEAWLQKKLKPETAEAPVVSSVWEGHMAAVLHCLATAPARSSPKLVGKITLADSEKRARRAVELDAENWRAHHVLAQVVESNSEAIRILQSTTDRLFADDLKAWRETSVNKKFLIDLCFTLGDRLLLSSDANHNANAIKAYLRSLELDSTYHSGYQRIISQYSKKKLWSPIVEFINQLLQAPVSSTSKTEDPLGLLMTESAWSASNILNQLVSMAKNTDRWDLLRELYDRGIAINREPGAIYRKFFLRKALGLSLIKEPKYEAEGLEKLEAELVQLKTATGCYVYYYMIPALMQIYIPRALSETSSPSSKAQYQDKIEKLLKRFKDYGDYDAERSNNLIFARYFCLRNELDRAKSMALGRVKYYLGLLSDEDVSNDVYAFSSLAEVFSTFEDKADAVAAWNLIAAAYSEQAKKHDEWKKKKSEWMARRANRVPVTADTQPEGPAGADEKSREKKDDDDSDPEPPEVGETLSPIFWCDVCGGKWFYASEVYVCMDNCGDVQLHPDCRDKFLAGEEYIEKCDKNHKFFFIPKQDEQAVLAMKPSCFRVGAEEISLEEWKNRIKKKYVEGVEDTEAK
ncbi:hypothetical protein QBC43DRAFT_300981 [Cladorrhinum sp. PSN259]|nr:hypothetical protein QBC43DRAFT_300981 [Cladorrhinum sp. PSN259]